MRRTLHLCCGRRVGSEVEVGSSVWQYGHNITAYEDGSWSHETRRASFLVCERSLDLTLSEIPGTENLADLGTKVLDVNTR